MAERQLLIRILGDSKGAQAAVDGLSGVSEKLSGHMAALGTAIGGALTVTAVTGFAASAIGAFESVAGATKNLQRLTGDTAEDASRLRTAFQLTGIDADAGANAIKKFSKSIEGGNAADDKAAAAIEAKNAKLSQNLFLLEQVKNPTAQQTEQMAVLRKEIDVNTESLGELNVNVEKYGIQTKNLDGSQKGTNQLLEETADIFKKMPDGMEKNALAMKLFGKSGTDMLPFLNKGAEGVKALEKESDKLGLTLSQKNVDAMAKSKAASREWHAALQGLQVQIGAQLMPILTTMSVWLAEHIPPAMEVLRAKFAEAQPYIERFGAFLQNDVLPVVAQVADYIVTNFPPAMAAVSAAVAVVVAYVQEHWPQIRDTIETVINAVRTVIEDVLGAIRSFWDEWGGTITRFVEGTFNGIRDTIDGIINIVRGIIQTVMALIHGDWQGAWDGIKKIVEGLWEALKGIVETGIAAIKGLFEGAVHILGDAWDLVWSKLKELAHAFFVDLPEYIGGKIADLGTFIIEHLWGALVSAWDATWDLAGKLHVFFADLPGKIADGVANIGTKIISGMWDALKAAWDLYWKLGEVINHGIASVMDDVIKAAENIGSQIVDGIVRIIKAAPGALLDALKSIIPSAGDVVGGIVGGITGHIPGLHAAGGFPQGMSWVGENGPELVDFGRGGARVHSAQQSQRMLAGGGGGTNVTVIQNFHGPVTSDSVPHLQNQAAAQFSRELTVALRGAA